MSELTFINKLVFLEDVVCVYRNYSYISEKFKYFVLMRIILEIAFYIYAFILFIPLYLALFYKSDHVGAIFLFSYNVFSKLNTLVAIILGKGSSCSFKSFVGNLNIVHTLCCNDVLYVKSFQKFYNRLTMVSLLLSAILIGLLLVYLFDLTDLGNNDVWIDFSIDYILQCRYICESIAFYAYIEVVVACLQYLSCSVLVIVKKLITENGSNTIDISKLNEALKHWGALIKILAECCKHLQSCFGHQILLSLLTATFYYIFLTYRLVYEVAQNKTFGVHVSGWTATFLMFSYLLIKIILIAAGQRTSNEAEKLNTSLSALKCLLLGSPEAHECARSTTSLLRRMRATPVRVQLVSVRALQMALLTEMLGAVAANTILLLQFTNVV